MADDRVRRGLQRVAGAHVVLVDGFASLYVKRGGRSVTTLDPFADEGRAARAVAGLGRVKEGAGGKSVAIESIDGVQALESPHFGVFEAQGYERDYLNLAFRGRSTPPADAW